MAIFDPKSEHEEKRKLHEKKMVQIQMKCQLEARNKILIQKKIESHQKARKQLLQRYFSHWSQIIITRRKQQGNFSDFFSCYNFREI